MQTIHANELLAGLTLAEPVPVTAVVTDSRKVQPGCVFVCFAGERVDGHDFAAAAYQNGAAYIVANHPVPGVPENRTVLVQDSALAMVRMASNYRMLFSPRMIGVTGSVGKTTTREMIAAVVKSKYKTLKTENNLNNEVGVPKTILELDPSVEAMVLEFGMVWPGEIRELTVPARPDIAVITCIGTCHIENLGSRENIKKAKLEIVEGLKKGGTLIQVMTYATIFLRQLSHKFVNRLKMPYVHLTQRPSKEIAYHNTGCFRKRALQIIKIQSCQDIKTVQI